MAKDSRNETANEAVQRDEATALNDWISAMASRMSSIRRCHFLDDTHGLGQDPVSNARLQALRRAKVDAASKQTLEVVLEFHESEQPDGSIELDQ